MATLNFSFAGESIHAAKLQSKTRKFELEFSNPVYTEVNGAQFTVEYLFTINQYAENLSEAFHLAAGEAGVAVEHLALNITGCLDSDSKPTYDNGDRRFNRIDVSLAIAADAPEALLEDIFRLAMALSPAEDALSDKVQYRFSLNTIIHLN
ncbi:hypothetical protein [Taibaiella koreensis]|uniref:hypothetical protein n=1 Tax=Taibaiella koreensis TaxID=1268548 RepID=UPI000E599DE1|nr:hypothetical protein [Taibaiella koreensis]